MKIVVIADLHLTHRFEKPLYDALLSVIKSADQVVINGDLWDAHLCSFDQFINSEWKQLFPLFIEKQAFYIFGNHDRERYSDERRKQFCVDYGYEIDLKTEKGVVHVEHGDKIAPSFDDRSKILPLLPRYGWWRAINSVLVKFSMSWFMDRHEDYLLTKYKAAAKKLLYSRGYKSIIFSHVHRQASIPEVNVFVTGVIEKGVINYAEIVDGEVFLHTTHS